jgi:phosphatidylglycerophosphate synthase
MNEKIYQSMKSVETEDWLDLHVIRPLCYYCAKGFAYFDIHPNTVTILSMFIGAGSCVFFAHGSHYYEGVAGVVLNLVAILLLMVADILDCTDGQLARMTGKKSKVGRILDGMAGFVWFTPIYFAIVWRF